MDELTSAQIRKLKALAQRLEPACKVGKNGLSESFVESVDRTLNEHELIKVKFVDFKEQKKVLAPKLAERTAGHLVTIVGNVAVLYRPPSDPKKRKIVF